MDEILLDVFSDDEDGDEPIMEGSDDEFSDLEIESEDDEYDLMDVDIPDLSTPFCPPLNTLASPHAGPSSGLGSTPQTSPPNAQHRNGCIDYL